jgi:6-pyruvoyltetrahydropterin/6-carboxytetrahydropterin synthase
MKILAFDPNRFPTRLVRRVHFSCGHQYALAELSEEENKKLFGSLYAPKGFGHNFVLDAYFEGPIDTVTGMVVNLRDVDQWLKAVTDPLDHHFLNTDVEYFKSHVPSVDNIAKYLFEELRRLIAMSGSRVELFKVRLYENDMTWVDYSDRLDVVL